MAWLFDIRREEKQRKPLRNLKSSISHEELITGFSEHSHDDEDTKYDVAKSAPGAYPAPSEEELREQYFAENKAEAERTAARRRKQDPTLQFSTLLIAKPLPFKFSLTPRDEKRVEYVRRLFDEKQAEGVFTDARDYWGPEHGKGKEFGWVGVTKEGKQKL